MKSEQKLTSLSFDPFPSFFILFCVKGEKGGKRKQKENALFLMWEKGRFGSFGVSFLMVK